MRYYIDQSIYSDAASFEYLFLDFPKDINFIRSCMQNLFLHYADLDLFCASVKKERYSELNNRYLYNILKEILFKNSNALIIPRSPDHRIMGICRDSSLLLCSILRFFSVPARLRSGYVTYFIPGLFLDGLVVEYYDCALKRWRLVDTRTSQEQIDHYHLKIDFDLTDIPENKFISAAKAWQLCRKGAADPNRFGSRQCRGLSVVRNRLIQDLALLNKEELLVWDVWGGMLEPMQNHISLMDDLAKILSIDENNLSRVRHFYESNPLLKVPDKIFEDSPFFEGVWVDLCEKNNALS
ncbi:MAG: hypothetical protein Q8L78_03755 [Coxiellaceae bacterium]|nr:hypothetical protein [Coxiellaceae bacterium]